MPDQQTLAKMYGADYYDGDDSPNLFNEHNKDPLRVIRWLKKIGNGTFVDYGCGTGTILSEALRLNWRAIGVEFDAEVAKTVEKRTGARVSPISSGLNDVPPADVLHLGDVIEHLTDINRQMPEILRLIKPGGLLLAQGPLEANANLFKIALRCMRSLRRTNPSTQPPYHVMLATAAGQRSLFRRLGLNEIEFSLKEVPWPAPGELSLTELRRPRAVILFSLRRVSQLISRLRPNKWGNRYFYVGSLPGRETSCGLANE
jgi:SAM-dependent methyltransferase